MIVSWTDSAGVTHWADSTSKAYRDRDEPAAPTVAAAAEPPAVDGPAEAAPELDAKPARRSARVD
ncbi:hypothetical protein ABZ412_34200 [Nocardia sp. NPDC005746]|uniref:hypothetical protein n=1 Tax=Nocardia sp. NPDC005746 TaxID=3157062 RepID=UPI0033EE5812